MSGGIPLFDGDAVEPPDQTRPPSRARARRTDPQTSHDAALAFTLSRLRRTQYDIYRLIALFGPAHDEEIVRRAKNHGVRQKESGIRTRRHELVEQGLLMDSGATVTLADSHRESTIWAVNPNPPPPSPSRPPNAGGSDPS